MIIKCEQGGIFQILQLRGDLSSSKAVMKGEMNVTLSWCIPIKIAKTIYNFNLYVITIIVDLELW